MSWNHKKRTRFSRPLILVAVFLLGTVYQPILFLFDNSLEVKTDFPYYENFVNRTNPNLIDGLRLVDMRIKQPWNIERFLKYRGSSGVYQPLDRSIYIPEASIWSQDIDIWWHELGHHVWYWKLTDEERERYIEIFERDKTIIQLTGRISYAGFPSNYAYVNGVSEDWADSFSFYLSPCNTFCRQWKEGRGASRVRVIESSLMRLTGCGKASPACAYADGISVKYNNIPSYENVFIY